MIRRTTKIMLEIVALVGAGLAILVVMAAFKLASGPLSVGFLTPYIVNALEPEDGSFRVSIDDAVLTWDRMRHAVQVRAIGVKVAGPAGDVRAEIPEMTVGFSGDALLRAQFAPTSLEVVGPRMTLVRDEDGKIQLTDAPLVVPDTTEQGATEQGAARQDQAEQSPTTPAPDGGEERPQVSGDFAADVLSDILAPPGPSNKMGYLTSLSVLDADVTLVDRKFDMVWHAPSSTFVFRKVANGLQLKSTFGLDIGGETAEFSLDGNYDTEDEVINAELQLADIQPSLFASKAPLFDMLDGIKLPISGSLRVRAGFDGEVQLFALDVTGGEGTVKMPGAADETATQVRSLRLRAGLTDDLNALQLDELRVDFGGPVVTATGSVQGVTQGVFYGPFEAVADVAVSNVTVADLKRLWPATAAANAQRWVTANIKEGVIHDGKFSFSGTAGDDGLNSFDITDLTGNFRYSDMVLSYFDTLPNVQKGHGTATMNKDSISFAIAGGEVQGLTVDSAKVDITGFNDPDQLLAVEVVARGAIRNVLTILDHRRLGYPKSMGIKPTDVGGDTALRLQVRMPLIDALTFKQVEIAAAAALRDVTFPKAAFDLDFTKGDLTLQLDGRGLDLSGKGVLGAVPVTLAWSENFQPKGYARQIKVQATVDDAGRRSLGLDFGDYVQGPAAIDAVLTQFPNKANTASINADLTPAVVDIADLGWRKEAGKAGKLKAELALTGDTPTAIKDFALDAEGFTARGNLTFGADGKTVNSVRISQLRYGRSDVVGDINRRGDGGYDIAIKGPALDASQFVKADTNPPDKQKAAQTPNAAKSRPDLVPLNIALTLSKLYLGDGDGFSNVSARMQRDKRHWRTVMIDGQPAPGKHFSINLAPDGANRHLQVRSDDAGSVLKIFDVSENIVGGQLLLNGAFDDSKPEEALAAKLEVTTFRLVKAPAIAKLLSIALLTGILDSLRGEGIGFDRLDIDFTHKNDVLETKNARAHGPALGLTAQGWVSTASQSVGLRGTIVPAYAVNSILNNIPVIGSLFGGQGSGIFAATYRMTGSLDDPEISVNPVAAVAPGFLRNLFGIFEGGAPKQPDAAPDPSVELELPEPQRD